MNVWMHNQDSVTQAHQDFAHNLLIQVVGRKHVLLVPPSGARCMHMFPSLHPRHRKSQLPLSGGGGGITLDSSPGSAGGGSRGGEVAEAPNFRKFIRDGIWLNSSTPGGSASVTELERTYPRFLEFISTGICKEGLPPILATERYF